MILLALVACCFPLPSSLSWCSFQWGHQLQQRFTWSVHQGYMCWHHWQDYSAGEGGRPAKALSVYWLTGLAGLGKTTIAYTICEQLEEAEVPFTSFFCSRQLDSKSSKLLVTTLCRNLAELFLSYASQVLPILESNSSIADAQLRRQMDELLAKPWTAGEEQRWS